MNTQDKTNFDSVLDGLRKFLSDIYPYELKDMEELISKLQESENEVDSATLANLIYLLKKIQKIPSSDAKNYDKTGGDAISEKLSHIEECLSLIYAELSSIKFSHK